MDITYNINIIGITRSYHYSNRGYLMCIWDLNDGSFFLINTLRELLAIALIFSTIIGLYSLMIIIFFGTRFSIIKKLIYLIFFWLYY